MDFYVKEVTGNFRIAEKKEIIQAVLKPLKPRQQFNDLTSIIGNVVELKEEKIEHVVFFLLDNSNKLIRKLVHSIGVEDQTAVWPKKIIRDCLKYCATGLIMVHNHPTGETSPSGADKAITKRLKECCDIFDIRLLDHIIIGNGFYSFRENRLL